MALECGDIHPDKNVLELDSLKLFCAVGRSTLFTAFARRSAHLLQFGSLVVFTQPKRSPYRQAPFFMLVTLVAITFSPSYRAHSSFIRPRETGIVWKSVTARLSGKA